MGLVECLLMQLALAYTIKPIFAGKGWVRKQETWLLLKRASTQLHEKLFWSMHLMLSRLTSFSKSFLRNCKTIFISFSLADETFYVGKTSSCERLGILRHKLSRTRTIGPRLCSRLLHCKNFFSEKRLRNSSSRKEKERKKKLRLQSIRASAHMLVSSQTKNEKYTQLQISIWIKVNWILRFAPPTPQAPPAIKCEVGKFFIRFPYRVSRKMEILGIF